jgi:hypothetical protein
MNIKTIFKRLLFPDTYSEAAYIEALKNKYHIDIGGGVPCVESKLDSY